MPEMMTMIQGSKITRLAWNWNLADAALTLAHILTCTELKGHCFVLVSGYVC